MKIDFYDKREGDSVYTVHFSHVYKKIDHGLDELGLPWIDWVNEGNGEVVISEFTLACSPLSDRFYDVNGICIDFFMPGHYDLITGSLGKANHKAKKLQKYYTEDYVLFKKMTIRHQKIGVLRCKKCGERWQGGRLLCKCL